MRYYTIIDCGKIYYRQLKAGVGFRKTDDRLIDSGGGGRLCRIGCGNIRRHFSEAPDTKNTVELKEVIFQNLCDKYHDLLTEGKTEECI